MTTFATVKRSVTETFDKLFGGMAVLDQPQGTAFSIYLAFLLSCARNGSESVALFSKPGSKTLDLLREKRCLINKDKTLSDGKDRNAGFIGEEYLWDIVVDQGANKRAHKLDVICESEMFPDYGISHFDVNDGYENGYIYDYVKVFYGNANIKLFTCRTSAKHHEPLGEKLDVWARFYTKLWDNGKLVVVILPTTGNDAIRIGIGVKEKRTGRLEFEEMRLPR
jgi:hypothetical protein